MKEVNPDGNNFMAAMRTDAVAVAPADYMVSVSGTGAFRGEYV